MTGYRSNPGARYLIAAVLTTAFLRSSDVALCADPPAWGYGVVASRTTADLPEWRRVIDALAAKHRGDVLLYEDGVRGALPELRQRHPRYTCFVARHEDVSRSFVADVHRLTRELDDDPYADTLWGILTGFDASNALAIARHAEPLTVRRVASGTEVALEMCEEGVWYDELVKNKVVRKRAGRAPAPEKGPDDTTQALVDTLNVFKAQLFVTSGHATERDWQIGYRYRNGAFVSRAGRMFGRDTAGREIAIDSPNPKVYLPIGNCLMGHINGRDSMALAWMNAAGVKQMIGYTRPTWYGYAGWGCLDYFLEQPARYTLNEAFHANLHALVHRLDTCFPGGRISDVGRAMHISAHDARGLAFDRDVVAFYGDPAWPARMSPGKPTYEQKLTIEGETYTLEIRPRKGAASFEPVNTNGSQRGWRPVVAFLPHRVGNVRLLKGAELAPVVTDDFVLVPRPRVCPPDAVFTVSFAAEPL